ncbi:MAG: hypothetical protein NVSMB16_00010 [Acidimicrobiales bacterium]
MSDNGTPKAAKNAPRRSARSTTVTPSGVTSSGVTSSGVTPATRAVVPATPAVVTERHLAKRRIREKMPPPTPGVTLPVTGWVVPLPTSAQLPWIAGLGIAAAIELIDWPVAILLAVGHTIMTNSKNEQLRELAEGIEAAL